MRAAAALDLIVQSMVDLDGDKFLELMRSTMGLGLGDEPDGADSGSDIDHTDPLYADLPDSDDGTITRHRNLAVIKRPQMQMKQPQQLVLQPCPSLRNQRRQAAEIRSRSLILARAEQCMTCTCANSRSHKMHVMLYEGGRLQQGDYSTNIDMRALMASMDRELSSTHVHPPPTHFKVLWEDAGPSADPPTGRQRF